MTSLLWFREKSQNAPYIIITYVNGASPDQLIGRGLKHLVSDDNVELDDASPDQLIGRGLKLFPAHATHHPKLHRPIN